MIRQATLADCRVGAEIQVQTWQAAYRGLMPQGLLDSLSVDQFEENWRKGISSLNHERLRTMAEVDGQIVGFLGAGPARWPTPGYPHELYAIYVLPSGQGRGVGRALVANYQAWLDERRLGAFMLWVLKDNHPSRRFYESIGCSLLPEEKADRMFGGVALTEVSYGWKK